MIDWVSISGFLWDAGNARKNEYKLGVSQSEAEQIFFNEPLVASPDIIHSTAEQRFHALGRTDDGRRLHITFTLRHKSTHIRVISAHDLSRKERRYYDQYTSTDTGV